ncbi:MBL fold metallo-hydrolase [Glaciihabitans sp. UYNi722]|uniref:MBL fold metallo-hydrolase n=1 Tax=Glaciihabitans sp. UYNi722 TaxID=3156344 RepID=UPI00339377DB
MASAGKALFENAAIGAVHEVAVDTYAVNAPFWGFPNVVYFLASGGKWALIDTGVSTTPSESIGPFLESRGGFGSLELVLGTHGHVDHIGGNGWVKEHAPQARFALGALDTGWAEDVDRHYCQLYEYGSPGEWKPDAASEELIRRSCGEPVAIDHPLVGGEILTFGSGREIEAVHLGAHSPGQMLYLDATSGTAFSGDAIQERGIFNTESNSRDFPMYRTIPDYIRSLERVRTSAPDRLCTAHAGIFSGVEADSFIDGALSWTAELSSLLQAIASRLSDFSLEQIVAEVHLARPEYAVILQIWVTTSEHLDELVRSGFLFPYFADKEKRWSVTRRP